MARSLFEVDSDELNGSNTPMIDSATPLAETVRPTTFVVPKSCVAVSGPSTTTVADVLSSSSVRKRPDAVDRERTCCQLAVVPVSTVVQLVVPCTSDTDDVDTPVTAWMSGATSVDDSAVTSPRVSVEAVPNPPRMPVLESVVLPGETTRTLVPRELMLSRTSAWAPCPIPPVNTPALL